MEEGCKMVVIDNSKRKKSQTDLKSHLSVKCNGFWCCVYFERYLLYSSLVF